MTDRFRRYAIYWTPEPGSAFDAFGSAWFGGENFGLDPALAERAKRAPARYGLHATLKAPFRLREGMTIEDMQRALDAFCKLRRAPQAASLPFMRHQRYVVLALGDETAAVDWLAAECVTHFDRFRAPLTSADRAAREIDTMTGRERAYLEDFGYPYVLSAFRFHISLAGPLERGDGEAVRRTLEPHLAALLREPFRIDALTLLGEPDDGAVFRILSRHRFMAANTSSDSKSITRPVD
ncbi:DUF1045 domain-containing protein [Rhodomicrobium lacus]|uniref:DUF1045 domain-containing protein n=1 Tax=Rhodomicrobium lacus TaxID=2498452 RepID=UPI0026E34ED2|nr:DUF1045 domain-containing protein [Rhodomicrobium lacus]WKW51174.1 DUF1045 domain-containing protein [Rhodomicrobium lacus]